MSGKESQKTTIYLLYVFLFHHCSEVGYVVFLRVFISTLFLYFLQVHPYLKLFSEIERASC